ncbi:MAG TPA: Mur ligase domain-containing protein [Candidatus Saccharimonadales bacterium]
MHIYFSGVGGVGVGPLAQIARDMGYEVSGSDMAESLMTKQLREQGVSVHIGQSEAAIAQHHKAKPIDWFVYTAALPADHTELQFAKKQGIRTSKRDELLAHMLKEKNLKLIAVAGTHGKTTTTAMFVWLMKQLNVPVSYSIGTTISFGASGRFDPKSEYFVYECDEYDNNFLHFWPHASLITALGYDHPDTFPTVNDYKTAFRTFLEQSDHTILWEPDEHFLEPIGAHVSYTAFSNDGDFSSFKLAGEHNRKNAFLVAQLAERLFNTSQQQAQAVLSRFPGTTRRFEQLAPNLYTDYGHHPDEVRAMVQLARELSEHVVVVYQPHQNRRQHELRHHYTDCMVGAEKVYWLPTYLSREDENQPILTPEELIQDLTNKDIVHVANLNEYLWHDIQADLGAGRLVLCLGAGSIDGWLREHI